MAALLHALNGLRVACISNEWLQLRFLSEHIESASHYLIRKSVYLDGLYLLKKKIGGENLLLEEKLCRNHLKRELK